MDTMNCLCAVSFFTLFCTSPYTDISKLNVNRNILWDTFVISKAMFTGIWNIFFLLCLLMQILGRAATTRGCRLTAFRLSAIRILMVIGENKLRKNCWHQWLRRDQKSWKISSQREQSCSTFSLMSFTVDLLLKAQICQWPTYTSALLMPYELEGSLGLGPLGWKTELIKTFRRKGFRPSLPVGLRVAQWVSSF